MAAEARAEPGLARPGDAVAPHQADVEAGAAGIGDDRHLGFRLAPRQMTAGDRRHARPGIDGMDRRRRHVGGIHHAALAGDGEQPAGEALRPQPLGETAQIGAHERLQGGVDAGGGGAAIFADRRIEAMRERDRQVRQRSAQDLLDPSAHGRDWRSTTAGRRRLLRCCARQAPARSRATAASSSGFTTRPSAPIRSGTSKVSARGT